MTACNVVTGATKTVLSVISDGIQHRGNQDYGQATALLSEIL